MSASIGHDVEIRVRGVRRVAKRNDSEGIALSIVSGVFITARGTRLIRKRFKTLEESFSDKFCEKSSFTKRAIIFQGKEDRDVPLPEKLDFGSPCRIRDRGEV